jgi:hypothetical protein
MSHDEGHVCGFWHAVALKKCFEHAQMIIS